MYRSLREWLPSLVRDNHHISKCPLTHNDRDKRCVTEKKKKYFSETKRKLSTNVANLCPRATPFPITAARTEFPKPMRAAAWQLPSDGKPLEGHNPVKERRLHPPGFYLHAWPFDHFQVSTGAIGVSAARGRTGPYPRGLPFTAPVPPESPSGLRSPAPPLPAP